MRSPGSTKHEAQHQQTGQRRAHELPEQRGILLEQGCGLGPADEFRVWPREVRDELREGLVAALRVMRHRLGQRQVHPPRQIIAASLGECRVGPIHVSLGVARERWLVGQRAGEHFVRHDAQGVDVRGVGRGLTEQALGCDVAHRADGVGLANGLVEFVEALRVGGAEVDDLGVAVAVNHHVLGFEVPMHDLQPLEGA